MTREPSPLDSPFGDDVWNVLARYLSNESPPDEADAVRRWVAGDPRRGQLLATLDRSLHTLASKPPADLDVDSAFRRVSRRLGEAQVRPMVRQRWLVMGLRAAAVIAIVLGATELWRRTQVPSPTHPVAGPTTYVTGVGQTDSVHLPDGSCAVLGPGSRLTLGADYGSAERDVRIAGEALFDVLHDPARPFAVRAGSALIRDLGTTFAVRDDGGLVHVVVVAGSVLLQDTLRQKRGAPESGLVLKAGERGTLLPQGETVSEPAAAISDDLAWTSGHLVFNNAPLPVVAAGLRRWYGIELRVTDEKLAGRHLTASFARESVAEVLSIIGLALGAEIERRGDTAVVRGR